MSERKTAVVTGGSRGIGKAVALRLAADGMNIAVLYAGNTTAAEETVNELRCFGVEAEAYQCDVSGFENTKKTAEEILARFGAVDVLVNNAGITRDGLVLNMTEEQWHSVIDTNLGGTFHMIRQFYGPMMRRRHGCIINISSVVGLHGNAGQANYAAAKAGVIGLTKSIAKELAGRGITCNAIAPGYIETDMTAVLSDRVKEDMLAGIPLKRAGSAEDIAAAVSFLASDDAAYITGTVLQVDGGLFL